METLATHTTKRKSSIPHKAIAIALSWVLAFWNISCGKTTQKDVIKQQTKVENLSFQISHYISARKEFVEKYNNLLKYPKNKSNENDINNSLSQLYEAIADYDKKIAKLAENKIDAEIDLNKYKANLWSWFIPNWPIDPNRWDYLLTIQ